MCLGLKRCAVYPHGVTVVGMSSTYAPGLEAAAAELLAAAALPPARAVAELSRLLSFSDPDGVPARVREAKRRAAQEALAEVGGSQVALARALGVSEQAVSRALRPGTRHPR
jgi:hypothetical protein